MANNFAKDYVDVATRLREMREIYPQLTMTQMDLKFITFGGQDWVVYTAAAYRTPDDQRPGVGSAWEPIPGKTPYTRDSELMVAETSAWGRALVAIGAETKNGIASANEVAARQVVSKSVGEIMAEALTAFNTGDMEVLRRLWIEAQKAKATPEQLAEIKEYADTLSKAGN